MTKGYSTGVTSLILSALNKAAEEGKTRKEAADSLGISYQTVAKYAADHKIAFRQRLYEFSKTSPHQHRGRCQFAVRLHQETYSALVEEAQARGLSVGVAARVLLEELLSVPASRAKQEAAE